MKVLVKTLLPYLTLKSSAPIVSQTLQSTGSSTWPGMLYSATSQISVLSADDPTDTNHHKKPEGCTVVKLRSGQRSDETHSRVFPFSTHISHRRRALSGGPRQLPSLPPVKNTNRDPYLNNLAFDRGLLASGSRNGGKLVCTYKS